MNIIALAILIVTQANISSWQSYKSYPQVDVMYKTEQCHDEVNGIHREYIILKFVNKTNNKIKLSWNLERYEGNVCSTCGKDEYNYSLELQPQQSIEGSCSANNEITSVFVKHLDLPNPVEFKRFELGNLKVSQ